MAPFLLAVSHRVKSPWAKPKHPESRTVASPFCKSRKAWFNRIRQFGRRRAASFSNPFLGGAAEEAEAGSNLAILALAAACLRSGSSDDSLFRGGPKEVAPKRWPFPRYVIVVRWVSDARFVPLPHRMN